MVPRCTACVTPWTSLGTFMCPICGTKVRLLNAEGGAQPSHPEGSAARELQGADLGAADKSP